MTIIFSIIGISGIVLLIWLWHILSEEELSRRISMIMGGFIGVYILTFFVYNISKIGVKYSDTESMKIVRTVFVVIFTIINSYIILPYTFKKIKTLDKKEKEKKLFKKGFIKILIIIIIVLIFECQYMGNIQESILNMAIK